MKNNKNNTKNISEKAKKYFDKIWNNYKDKKYTPLESRFLDMQNDFNYSILEELQDTFTQKQIEVVVKNIHTLTLIMDEIKQRAKLKK